MSRSYKKPWIKDKSKLNYNKIIRSNINQIVKTMLTEEDVEIPNPRTIINDYDIMDYKFESDNEKYKRK